MLEENQTEFQGIQVFAKSDFPVKVMRTNRAGKTKLEYHTEWEIQLISKGTGAYFILNRQYPFSRNSVMIMHCNEIHNYIPDHPAQVEKTCLVFSEKLLLTRKVLLTILHDLLDCHHIVLGDIEAAKTKLLLDEINSECIKKPSYWKDAALSCVERLLILLDRSRIECCEPPKIRNDTIERVLHYIEKEISQKISLKHAADVACLSPDHLSREFKKYVGLGFQTYIIRRRVVEAGKLLTNTDAKVISIAYSVGFDDISSFNRSFKLHTGITPSEYRKISLKNV